MDTYSLTQEQAAERVGKSRPAVANALRLLSLPAKIILLLKEGKLSSGHARALLPLKDEKTMLLLCKEIEEKELSVRETEKIVKNLLSEKKEKKEKKPKKRDPYYDECELSIREALGRKANINLAKGDKGTVEIEFFGKDDLKKILKSLAGE